MNTLIASLLKKNYWISQTKLFTILPTLPYGVQNFHNLRNTSQNTEKFKLTWWWRLMLDTRSITRVTILNPDLCTWACVNLHFIKPLNNHICYTDSCFLFYTWVYQTKPLVKFVSQLEKLRSIALDGIGGFLYPVQNLELLPYRIAVVICVPLLQRVQQANLTTKLLSAYNRICNNF